MDLLRIKLDAGRREQSGEAERFICGVGRRLSVMTAPGDAEAGIAREPCELVAR